MGKCSTVVSGAEWPGVTINQGGKKSVGRKKIVRNLARRYPEDILPLLLLRPFDIKYQAISSSYRYLLISTTLWFQICDQVLLYKLPIQIALSCGVLGVSWWYYYLWYRYRNTITNVPVYLHIVEVPRHGLGGRYLILLAGSWYAALTIPQLSKHYSVGLYFRSTSIVRGKDELEMFAD